MDFGDHQTPHDQKIELIVRFISVIHAYALNKPNRNIQVAALSPLGGRRSLNFPCTAEGTVAAAAWAITQNQQGRNVYLAPASFVFATGYDGALRNDDVVAVAWLWLDLDGAGDAERANEVLQELELAPTIVVTTGKTPHLRQHYYIALKTPCEGIDNWVRIAKALIKRAGGDAVGNASRIMRLPYLPSYPPPKKIERGYVDELVEAEIIEYAPAYSILDIEKHLAAGTGDARPSAKPPEDPAEADDVKAGGSVTGSRSQAAMFESLDMGGRKGRSDAELIAVLEATKTEGQWHINMLRAVATMVGRGYDDARIHSEAERFGRVDNPPRDAEVQVMIDGARRKSYGRPAQRQTNDEIEDDITEDSVAKIFTRRHCEDCLYEIQRQAWIVWDDGRWRRQGAGVIVQLCREIARDLAANIDAKKRTNIKSAKFAKGAEALARNDPAHHVDANVWIADPMLLGVPGGCVDLSTGETRPARRQDFLTQQTGVAPAVTTDCPRWKRFLLEICEQDVELVDYLQRVCGYLLTGHTSEHALWFIYGPGGNGKSTFIETIKGVLGDYATTAPMEMFVTSPFNRHPTELAHVQDARLVTATETESGRAWAESRIKQMTGGDAIVARRMREDFQEYRPVFKLIIAGNHKPRLTTVDKAIRRRFRIVSFTAEFAQIDKNLEQVLRDEWPGILRWMIDGCLAWREKGLAEPPVVLAATNAYFDAQDIVGEWLEENCVADASDGTLWTSIERLFENWRKYAESGGHFAGTKIGLAHALEKRGFGEDRRYDCGTRLRGRVGIKILRHYPGADR